MQADRPFFGICLGYQVLFEQSEETPGVEGLGFFTGSVIKFDGGHGLKIPHMGWNEVKPTDRSFYAWQGTPDPLHLYFVHSFFPKPDDESIINSVTEYGAPFASSVAQGNIFAGQFHPERSQDAGLALVRNFLETEKSDNNATTLLLPGALNPVPRPAPLVSSPLASA